MTEEHVTKSILNWLIQKGWYIVCFDFPQSGTGILIHPDSGRSEKNKGSINPDIIAVKDKGCVYFENKDHYYLPDFYKVNSLIRDNHYSVALNRLLAPFNVDKKYFGIGLPIQKYGKNAYKNRNLVDFIVGVESDFSTSILWESEPNIFDV